MDGHPLLGMLLGSQGKVGSGNKQIRMVVPGMVLWALVLLEVPDK